MSGSAFGYVVPSPCQGRERSEKELANAEPRLRGDSCRISDPRKLIGQARRLGDAGPAYEVVAVDEQGKVAIEVIHSGERAAFPVEEVLEDPMAETFP